MDITRTIAFLGLLVYVLQFFTSEHYVFIPIVVITFFLALREFKANRKDLASANYYSRVITPLKLNILSFIVVALLLTFLYIVQYIYELEYDNETFVYFFLVVGNSTLSGWYQNFKNSIRSYENGIKLPGWKEKTIDWQHINGIVRSGQRVLVETNNGNRSIKIVERDISDMDSIISNWKESCL
jgi:hypothetical protein